MGTRKREPHTYSDLSAQVIGSGIDNPRRGSGVWSLSLSDSRHLSEALRTPVASVLLMLRSFLIWRQACELNGGAGRSGLQAHDWKNRAQGLRNGGNPSQVSSSQCQLSGSFIVPLKHVHERLKTRLKQPAH